MEDFVHVTGLERRFEGGRAVQSLDLSIYHDGDTVAILRLVHIVGGDKDRNTPFGSLVDQLPELAAGDRIDTSGRFIQENDPRFVDDGDGESQLLLPAQRQGIDQCVSFVLQIKDPEQFVRLRFQLFFRQTVDAAVQTDILPYLQVAIKGKLLAHIADMPLDQFRFLIDIETGNLSHPGSRCQKAAQHTHGCRLAGSVRSQETEDLSLAYRETDVVDSGKGTETFR